MKNWQDYATNVDTGTSPKAQLALKKVSQTKSSNTTHPLSRGWLVFNILLVILCGVSLVFSLIATFVWQQQPENFFANIGLTFLMPGMLVLAIANNSYLNSSGATFIFALILSVSLGIGIYVNFFIAAASLCKNKSIFSYKLNFLCATIPPLYIIISLILLLICHP